MRHRDIHSASVKMRFFRVSGRRVSIASGRAVSAGHAHPRGHQLLAEGERRPGRKLRMIDHRDRGVISCGCSSNQPSPTDLRPLSVLFTSQIPASRVANDDAVLSAQETKGYRQIKQVQNKGSRGKHSHKVAPRSPQHDASANDAAAHRL